MMPELSIVPGQNLEVVEEIKIVGFMLRSDLKTSSNTKYIVKKAYARMWILRRLKALGAAVQDLLAVLQKQVLFVLYPGAQPGFHFLHKLRKMTSIGCYDVGCTLCMGNSTQVFIICFQNPR